MNVADFRREMPVTQHWAYLDHAAVSPLPARAAAAMTAWLDDVVKSGDFHWSAWDKQVNEVRVIAARLLGAHADEIALVHNTTEGINLVAEGFPWKPGDNVVFPADEFPSNRFAWLNLGVRGVEARAVPRREGRPVGCIDEDDLAAACDSRTRVIAASWVDYATGFRRDLAALSELARRYGAYLFVDAIQGLGVFPIDVHAQGVDFLAADGHKWLLGPEGAAVFFVRRELLNLLRPLGLGWNSAPAGTPYDRPGLTIESTAARYEGGSLPAGNFLGLRESLLLLEQMPVQERARQVLEVAALACDRLRAAGAIVVSDRAGEHASGIVAFLPAGVTPQQVRRVCHENGVVVNCRAGYVRISPHLYNHEDDIQRLVGALSKAVAPD